jgi:hypothetical protein
MPIKRISPVAPYQYGYDFYSVKVLKAAFKQAVTVVTIAQLTDHEKDNISLEFISLHDEHLLTDTDCSV